MKVAVIGLGAMGRPIAGHVARAGHEVVGWDVDGDMRAEAAKAGIDLAESLADAARRSEVFLVVVATDAQSEGVAREILTSGVQGGARGGVIVIVATNSPKTMQTLAGEAAAQGFDFVDAPVCFGRQGAEEGNLASLCGGTDAAIARVTPVLMAYSRAVHHVGPVGAGQLGKACNNMMHWAACVASYEVLLLAKRYGLDAQRMREILLECPARNTTLERWDTTRFTWHEKDMDLALDLAQSGSLPLPLFGHVDQLIKRLGPDQVQALLHGDEAEYLGLTVTPMAADEGGLG